MHVYRLCLCTDCIRAEIADDEEHRAHAKALIATLGTKRSQVQQLAHGIVRRLQPASA
jgi:hypothetical protein